jgi:hypothetical protein
MKRLSLDATNYDQWRRQFLGDRLQLCLKISLIALLSFTLHDTYYLFLSPHTFESEMVKFYGNVELIPLIRQVNVVTHLAIGLLFSANLILFRLLQKRHPMMFFLFFSWSVTIVPQIIGTIFRLPDPGMPTWLLVFLIQATLMPLHWRLHLLSQVVPLLYAAIVFPLLGLTTVGQESIYQIQDIVAILCCCLICNVAVFLYERLQRAEFQSRQELHSFLKTISQDLQNPVIETATILKTLLETAEQDQVTIERSVLEQLLGESDRQFALLTALRKTRQG